MVSISIVKALQVKTDNFVKTNIKVATASDCKESRNKRVDFIVLLLTSFLTSYIFSLARILISHCTRLKQKRTIFMKEGEIACV